MPPGYALALALTQVIELPVAAALAPRGARGRVLATLFFANLLTHPIAWWLVAGTHHPARFWPIEAAVLLTELVGLTLDNARSMLAEADHEVWIAEVREVEASGTEPGTIIGQAPDVGSTMEPNGSMLVEVTIEPQRPEGVVVPALIQRLLPSVTPTLEALGLGYQIVEVADPDEPEWTSGLVWSQDPAPGTIVEAGAVITLRVAP